jgi:hypothetical protein
MILMGDWRLKFKLLIFKTLSFSILLTSSTFAAKSAYAPDATKEKKIYKKFKEEAAKPTDERIWWGVQAQSKAQTYKVQKGDTLSEISDTLFADVNFWPKVWSLNSSQIFNPHEIEPSMTISFLPGNSNEPPSINLVKDPGSLKMAGESISEDVLALTWDFEIPPPKRQFPNVENHLPDSLPTWKMTTLKEELPVLDLGREKFDIKSPKLNLEYFIAAKSPEAIGQIVGTETGADSASDGQYVYVQFDKVATKSSLVTVLRTLEEVSDRKKRREGALIQLQGQLKILERVNDQKIIYRAEVVRTLHPIEVGSSVSTMALPTYTLKPIQKIETISASSIPGRIIGGSFVKSRQLFGEDGVIFISLDESSQISVGQNVNIFKSFAGDGEALTIDQRPRKIGIAEVIMIEGPFVTAVVRSQSSEIRYGDVTSPDLILK